MKGDSVLAEANFKLHPKTSPKGIDHMCTKGVDAGTTTLGIY